MCCVSNRHSSASAIRQGEIYWIVAPQESDVEPVAHPHLVLQDDLFNRSRIDTVIVCALTSNLKRASEPGNVLLDEGEGGLPKQSVIVVSQVSSVERAKLGELIGRLSVERVQQALDGLRFQQESFFGRRED